MAETDHFGNSGVIESLPRGTILNSQNAYKQEDYCT